MLAWLAVVPEGKVCAASIYSSARSGSIDITLPREVSLEAWVWGGELESGVFAQELLDTELHFRLPCDHVDFSVLKRARVRAR